jgi:hypothetical protein
MTNGEEQPELAHGADPYAHWPSPPPGTAPAQPDDGYPEVLEPDSLDDADDSYDAHGGGDGSWPDTAEIVEAEPVATSFPLPRTGRSIVSLMNRGSLLAAASATADDAPVERVVPRSVVAAGIALVLALIGGGIIVGLSGGGTSNTAATQAPLPSASPAPVAQSSAAAPAMPSPSAIPLVVTATSPAAAPLAAGDLGSAGGSAGGGAAAQPVAAARPVTSGGGASTSGRSTANPPAAAPAAPPGKATTPPTSSSRPSRSCVLAGPLVSLWVILLGGKACILW